MKKSLQVLAAAGTLAASLAAAPSFALTRADQIGTPTSNLANRVVVLDGRTRSVNVDQGQVIQFVTNGKSFQWLFDGTSNQLKLSEIAPTDFDAPEATVYVNQSMNPLTESSGGGE